LSISERGIESQFSHIFLKLTPGKTNGKALRTLEALPLLIFLELMVGFEPTTCALRVCGVKFIKFYRVSQGTVRAAPGGQRHGQPADRY
jgi:hypothetical protein